MRLIRAFLLLILPVAVLTVRSQTIPDQIDAILARSTVAGNTWSVLVESEDGSTTYYSRNADVGLAPASNTKLFTTAAAFGLLGTNYAFETRIYADGVLSDGTLTGNLNLVSEHDITWNTTVFSGNARAALDHIASRLKSLGLTRVTGAVQCYGLCAYNLGSTDYLTSKNTTGRNADAVVAFNAALNAQGITTSGTTAGLSGFSPPGTLFYTHRSTDMTYGGKPLRLDVACIPLLKVSHNVMADGLCRHLGWKFGTGDSYPGGAYQVLRWMSASAGLNTNGISMNDGSGLSHANRFSARKCIDVTRFMLGAYPSWATGLPIGCVDGTIGSRFCGTDASGVIRAKTGSLSISIALSGCLDNKYDGRRFLFSFLANKTSIAQTDTRNAIDDSIVLYAGRGIPISPQLNFVIQAVQPDGLLLSWSDEKFRRTGYRVYASEDGQSWGAPVNLPANVQSWVDAGIPEGASRFYKVTVVNGSEESGGSRVYGAVAGSRPSRVLVVDGDDRWQYQRSENPYCRNHTFAAISGRNISGVGFDTANHLAVIDGSIHLTNYPAVVWLLGEESSVDETFDTDEQALVTQYLAAGGNLFVSGAEVAWDLDRDSGPTTADRNFLKTQLHASLGGNANDDAATYVYGSAANSLFAGNPSSGFDNGTHGTYNVDYPDILTPQNGSTPALVYIGGLGGTAAIQYSSGDAGGRVVFMGFPFETITNSAARDACMSDVLRFFGVLDPPRLLAPVVSADGSSVTVRWTSNAGLNYRVEYRTSLAAPWQPLGPDILATGTTTSKADLISGGGRFYRVVLQD